MLKQAAALILTAAFLAAIAAAQPTAPRGGEAFAPCLRAVILFF